MLDSPPALFALPHISANLIVLLMTLMYMSEKSERSHICMGVLWDDQSKTVLSLISLILKASEVKVIKVISNHEPRLYTYLSLTYKFCGG